ncbi:hypothetical protein FVA81_12850 [Rhizobium sp. WL3]|nr:hypothetical protein FVA81_12850 [Rhizobium sp. WL3]
MVPARSSRHGISCSRHLSRSQAEIPLIPAVQISRASSDPLAVEHDVDTAITEAASFRCYLLHRLPNGRIIRPHAAISHARPIHR